MITAQQSLWSLLSQSLRDLMLLFYVHIPMMTKEVTAYWFIEWQLFSNLLLFFFFIMIKCCTLLYSDDMLINYSVWHQFLSCYSLSVITDTLYILCSCFSMWVKHCFNDSISANISSSEKLIETLTVLLKSTAHTLCVLNTHQSHCHQKYIELCEQQCIEKIKSKTSSDSEEKYKTAVE